MIARPWKNFAYAIDYYVNNGTKQGSDRFLYCQCILWFDPVLPREEESCALCSIMWMP
jgi:hypothetical protein